MIQLNHLNVTYQQTIHALHDVTLDINRQKTAILGLNGSGKSTMLQAIVGLVEFDGEIIVNGVTSSSKTMAQIRKMVGFIFQNPDHQLFMNTIREDIAFGLQNQGLSQEVIQEKVETIAKQLDIEDLLDRNTHQLSGGQKRMVAMATVLVMSPDIILMDEPTSFLDGKARRHFIELVQQLDCQVIIITHDLEMAKQVSDEVILMNDGQCVCQMEANAFFEDATYIQKYELD